MKRSFGLISYEGNTYANTNLTNLGDYVQSIAARQFLPEVNELIPREKLNEYNGEPLKMIMNAWYMANPNKFPPVPSINPLYVSIHINSTVKDEMTSNRILEHFKEHEPIGCRDNYTRDLLLSKGVNAYYSGCLTLTLGQTYKRDNITDDIFIIDPMFDSLSMDELIRQPLRLAKRIFNGRIKEHNWRKKILQRYFDKEILDAAQTITQIVEYVSVEDCFKLADEYLKKLANAKLVITSRIHCALPCLAMGTPVIFINGGFNSIVDNCRFDGLNDFFNRIDVDHKTGKSKTTFDLESKMNFQNIPSNKNLHVPFSEKLIADCESFVR